MKAIRGSLREQVMWDESETGATRRERMSALLDGELDRDAVIAACAHWHQSAESRAVWHAYHLIGDALRSDDLARHPARDASFLHGLRARLAEEPVVLAPVVAAAPADPRLVAVPGGASRRRAWRSSVAIAAGVVVVAGVLTSPRLGVLSDRPAASQSFAQTPTPAPVALADRSPGVIAAALRPETGPASGAAPAVPESFVANDDLIRDARLDRYLAAHQQFAGSSALGVPSAYLRNATAEVPGR
ncbi:MAG: sigma-E factor negative regulatory protein [Pseudomonadota bacterium]|nr:sigma-E factor negative regulatory protein [Pseudomonadota bacterium]